MRLVDADKIIITRQEYVGALTLRERLRRLLKVQPTIEAIPIEIIRKRIEGYRNSVINISDIEVKKFYKTCAYELERLISWWEVENEID